MHFYYFDNSGKSSEDIQQVHSHSKFHLGGINRGRQTNLHTNTLHTNIFKFRVFWVSYMK